MSFEWRGAEQLERVLKALVDGIDKSCSEGTAVAKQNVHVDTATLQGSIRPDRTRIVGNVVVGQFGSHDVNYAVYQEFLPPSRGGKPYLRPGEDEARKNLQGNIEDAWRSQL